MLRAADVFVGLIRIAEEPQVHAAPRPASDTRVVAAVCQGVRCVLRRTVESQPAFGMLPAGGELAKPRADTPRRVEGLKAQVVIVLLLGQLEQLVAERPCLLGFPTR